MILSLRSSGPDHLDQLDEVGQCSRAHFAHNSFGGERGDLGLHPTVKPVAMVANAIRDCSHRKGIVLDAFIGSGTTLIAAEKTGRRGYGIEIDPAYCDVAIRRLRAVCGLDAVLEGTGQRYGEVAAERTPEPADALPHARLAMHQPN